MQWLSLRSEGALACMATKTMLRTLLLSGFAFVAMGVVVSLAASDAYTSTGITLMLGGVIIILTGLLLTKAGE